MKILNCFFIITTTMMLNSCGKILENLPLPVKRNIGGRSGLPSHSSLRWAEANLPLRIVAPISMQATVEPSLRKVCDAWNTAAGRHIIDYSFEDYSSSIPSPNILRDRRHRIYLQSPWSNVSNNNSALALTFYTYSDTVMLEGDIVFNTNFNFYFSDASPSGGSSPSGQFDFETILLHEVGHFLGLDHNSDRNSIMYPSISSGVMKRSLHQLDITEISIKYQ